MDSRQSGNTNVERQLRRALDAAECREARYHIRESMQMLHLDDDEE